MMLLLLIEIEDCEEIDADDTSPSFGMAEPNKKKYGNVNEANGVRVKCLISYSTLVICRDYEIDHFQL